MFFSGQRPAVNVGLSVSRVGGSAQIKAMKKIAGPLRINLAQYRELEAFAQFGSDLDKQTRDKLFQGARLFETLKQPQYSTLPVEEQVVILYSATNKYLMDLPVNKVSKFNKELVEYVKDKYPRILTDIAKTGNIDDENIKLLKTAVEEFKGQFV